MYLFNKMRGIFVVSSHIEKKRERKKNEGEALLFVSRRFFCRALGSHIHAHIH